MIRVRRTFIMLTAACLLFGAPCGGQESSQDDVFEIGNIISIMHRGNDYQLKNPWKETDRNWIRATYYTGVMAFYKATGDQKLLNQAMAWGEKHKWEIGSESHPANRLTCVQTYLELYFLKHDESMIAKAKRYMDSRLLLSQPAYKRGWDYIDALYVGPPAFAMMSKATADPKYNAYMNRVFWEVADYLYDGEEGLFYRDHKARTKEKSRNGKKVLWSRGNGWIMGGLPRILTYLPKDDPNRKRYEDLLRTMAATLLKRQGEDGLWRANLGDPKDFSMPESSGSGFFTYAIAWGINNGVLDKKRYLPVVRRAWQGLCNIVDQDGKVCWGQLVGRGPYVVKREHSHEYVTGTFLLAGSEMLKISKLLGQTSLAAYPDNTSREIKLFDKAEAAVKAAIPQAEKDPTRPIYHFRPPSQWMNDISGAIYYKGYYHAFYHYNPFSDSNWGVHNGLWAHARSKDLVHWEHLPWAFLPMKDRGEKRCNSGCVTLDGNGKPTIFYTFVPPKEAPRHQWALKPLDDDLIKWARVADEPLMAIGKKGIPADTPGGWSDPFVFKSEGRTFVTFKSSNGLVCEAKDKELMLWEYAGRLEGVSGECPNFFPLQGKWVLIRSTHPISYVVGDFDSKTIAFKNSGPARTMDYGFGKKPPRDRPMTRGLYATNTFTDENKRRILFGWISGHKAKRGWNGCMSLPRILTLDEKQRLIQTPAPELQKLRGRLRSIKTMKLTNKEERLNDVNGDTMEILAEFLAGDAKAFGLKVRQSTDGKNAVTIRYTNGKLNVAGTDVPLKLPSGKLKLHVFIDRSVLEVFINDGVTSVSRVEYPGEKDIGVSVFAEKGSATLKSLDVWKMKSIW